MLRLLSKLILFVIIGFSLCIKGYAEDKKYHLDGNYRAPNYNDPTKPNYVSGTRTDMAPKVENKEQSKTKSDFCEPSEKIKKEFNRLETQKGSKAEVILLGDTVSGYRRLQEDWDKECEEKEKSKNKYSSESVLSPVK